MTVMMLKSVAGELIMGKFDGETDKKIFLSKPMLVVPHVKDNQILFQMIEYLPGVFRSSRIGFNKDTLDIIEEAADGLTKDYLSVTSSLVLPNSPKFILNE